MTVTPLSAHDARERHLQLTQFDGLGLRFNRPTDGTIWHYTNIAGLNGILSTGSLWSSDYRYLNDTTELLFGLEVLEMVVAHDLRHVGLTRDLRRDILMEIAMMKRSNMSMYVLTCSFCTRGNVLSQWRAYARQDGVAIGFHKNLIEGLGTEQNFTTGMVYYYWSQSQQDLPAGRRFPAWLQTRVGLLLDSLAALERAATVFDQAMETGDESVPYASIRQKGSVIKKWCAETAAFIKHPAFEEEQEWRCLKVIDETILIGQTQVEHRAAGTRIVPYVRLSLQSQAVRDFAIRQLVIGPNADGPATMHSAEFLTRRYDLDNVSIAMPFQPLRS